MRRLIRPVGVGLVATVLAGVLWVPTAGAGGGGGAARGDGDEIISSILQHARLRRSGRTPAKAPPCAWRKLTDEQVVFLMHVLASMPELRDSGFQGALDQYLSGEVVQVFTDPITSTTMAPTDTTPTDPAHSDPAPTGSTGAPTTGADGRVRPSPTTGVEDPVQVETRVEVTNFYMTVEICNGVANQMQVRSQPVSGAGSLRTAARGVTELRTLPPAVLHISPPTDSVLLGEPVFVDVDRPAPVNGSITLGGTTVDVVANPRSVQVFEGEFDQDVGERTDCDFDSGFDPASSETVAEQMAHSCVLFYEWASGDEWREQWNGYALVHWDGHYRVDRGPATDLGNLYSFTPFSVRVEEMEAVIERSAPVYHG